MRNAKIVRIRGREREWDLCGGAMKRVGKH